MGCAAEHCNVKPPVFPCVCHASHNLNGPSIVQCLGFRVNAQTSVLDPVQSGKGLSFSNLNDGFNGMSVAMGIMAIEWALFLVLAWYFDQVLYTGEGNAGHHASHTTLDSKRACLVTLCLRTKDRRASC